MSFLLGREEVAGELISFIRGYMEMVSERTSALAENQKLLVYFELGRDYTSCNKETFTHELISLAGGINIAAEETVRYPLLNSEYIIVKDPKVIVKLYYATTGRVEEEKAIIEEISNRPGWSYISAIKEGKVYPIPSSEASVNPRFVIGLLKFAKLTHPNLFGDVNVDSVQSFLLERFYGY